MDYYLKISVLKKSHKNFSCGHTHYNYIIHPRNSSRIYFYVSTVLFPSLSRQIKREQINYNYNSCYKGVTTNGIISAVALNPIMTDKLNIQQGAD